MVLALRGVGAYAEEVDPELERAREEAVERSLRMDARAGLLSEARYFGHRISKAERERADRATEEQREDAAALARFVAWALTHHREAMLRWAEEAAQRELSAAYREGWRRTLESWRGEAGEDPPPALFWLIAMWHRSEGE